MEIFFHGQRRALQIVIYIDYAQKVENLNEDVILLRGGGISDWSRWYHLSHCLIKNYENTPCFILKLIVSNYAPETKKS